MQCMNHRDETDTSLWTTADREYLERLRRNIEVIDRWRWPLLAGVVFLTIVFIGLVIGCVEIIRNVQQAAQQQQNMELSGFSLGLILGPTLGLGLVKCVMFFFEISDGARLGHLLVQFHDTLASQAPNVNQLELRAGAETVTRLDADRKLVEKFRSNLSFTTRAFSVSRVFYGVVALAWIALIICFVALLHSLGGGLARGQNQFFAFSLLGLAAGIVIGGVLGFAMFKLVGGLLFAVIGVARSERLVLRYFDELRKTKG